MQKPGHFYSKSIGRRHFTLSPPLGACMIAVISILLLIIIPGNPISAATDGSDDSRSLKLNEDSGELFTALTHLSASRRHQADLIANLQNYVELETSRLDRLDELVRKIRHEASLDEALLTSTTPASNQTGDDSEAGAAAAAAQPIKTDRLEWHLSNPVNAYVYVKKFVRDWPRELSAVMPEFAEVRKSRREELARERAQQENNGKSSDATSDEEEEHYAETLQERVELQQSLDFIKEFLEYQRDRTALLVTEKDWKGVLDGMLRLQTTYRISARDLAAGNLRHTLWKRDPRFSVKDETVTEENATEARQSHDAASTSVQFEPIAGAYCFAIGHRAYEISNWESSVDWLQLALEKHNAELASNQEQLDEIQTQKQQRQQNEDDATFLTETEERLTNRRSVLFTEKSQILDFLFFGLGMKKQFKEAIEMGEELLQMPESEVRGRPRIQSLIDGFQTDLQEQQSRDSLEQPANQTESSHTATAASDAVDDQHDNPELNGVYPALCRGQRVPGLPDPVNNALHCYWHTPHPYFYIRPIKVEQHAVRPWLVTFHDIITEPEIERIKQLARNHLNRATVRNPLTGVLEHATYRISKSAWLPYNMDEVTRRINQRIEMITGLDVHRAEDLQVVNYGIGGHYAPHFDHGKGAPRDEYERKNGRRIATLIYYLSPVEEGGYTAFTTAGLWVKPSYRGAAFWYNLFPSGDSDDDTRHAGCPVVIGSKWVMNKWFRERGQEFRRKCNVDRFATV